MKVAATQLDVVLGDVDANLAQCERLAREAARAGAEVVALPEFFSTGAAFDPKVVEGIRPQDGEPAQMLPGRVGEATKDARSRCPTPVCQRDRQASTRMIAIAMMKMITTGASI